MKGIDVERIRFEFGDSWTIVEKWDDADVFRNGIQRLSGSKAVDLVGVREGCLYLMASSPTQPRVRVVAWIEDGGLRHAESHSKRGARHTTLYTQLQQSLVWLTRHVSMESPLRVTGIGDAHATRLGKP